MMMIKKVYKKISLVVLIMLSGCSLDHNIRINLTSDNYTVDYIQSREFDYMPYFTPFNELEWIIADSTENELHYHRIFNYSEKFPSLFTINKITNNEIINDSDYIYVRSKNKEIVLKSPYLISKNNFFIFTDYRFEGTFKGRRIKNNYDKLINYYSGFFEDAELIINGDELRNNKKDDFELIINQLLNFLYLETINNSNISYNQKSIYLNALKNWKEDKKLNSLMTNNMTGLSRDQLREIINAAEEFLYRETNNEYSNELQEIWRDLELDIYTSLLLLFNDFNLEITVPGDMVSNNADSSYNNTFYWDVGINNFLDKDYNVFVKNRVINKMRIIFILFLIIILGATVVKIKYFKT